MLTNSIPPEAYPTSYKSVVSQILKLIYCAVFFCFILPVSGVAKENAAEDEIIPMLECIRWVPEKSQYQAVFGYNNPSKSDVTIPPEQSSLSCLDATIEGRQPMNIFKPGRVFSAFTVTFSCNEITWTVTGPSGKPMSVTANGSSTACATGGNITPNISSPIKTGAGDKTGSELFILKTASTIKTDLVYQIEELNGIKHVFIQLKAMKDKSPTLLAAMGNLGFKGADVAGIDITGWLPVDSLSKLNNLTSLYVAFPVFTPIFKAGAVTSQGDKAQRTNLTRTAYKVQGEGSKIGVLSDSYNARTGTAALLDVQQGDLPGAENPLYLKEVKVLRDMPKGFSSATDEGRAMLQIIHDVAPKAELFFRTGFDGPLDLANGIRELKRAGCNIIVDDITYITDHILQDGIVAQAVDEVVAGGVTYFSAAGNFGERSYQGTFNSKALTDGRKVHNFGGNDHLQRVFLPEGSYLLGMQWDSEGEQDLDFYLTDDSGNIIIGYNRTSGLPFEGMAFHVSAGGAVANIMVVNASVSNVPVTFKYIIYRGNAAVGEYRSGSSTIAGHANAAGAIAIGAVLYTNTPSFGGTPSIASFSSRGGTPILRNATGSAVNITRAKPDFAAPNGVNTTVPLGGINIDGDLFPNFFGTSASAPHAAAAAALLMEAHKKFSGPVLTPANVRTKLSETALDMGTAGFDNASGHGFIRPDAAISTFATPTPIADSLTPTEGIVLGNQLTIQVYGHYFKGSNQQGPSVVYYGGNPVVTTYKSTTQLEAVIPSVTENQPITVYSPPTSILRGDGGHSNPIYLFPKTVITIKADNKTKRYGDKMPELTVSPNPANLTKDDITFTTLATDLSDVGIYVVTPSLRSDHVSLKQLTEQYEFVYEPGILTIQKIDLVVQANDVAITNGDPITGFNYSYSFITPINNTEERKQLILEKLKQEHKALQTNKVALVTEMELFKVTSIQNSSFMISATAEANAAKLINGAFLLNGTYLLNISSQLLNELASNQTNSTKLINGAFLINAAFMLNASSYYSASRIINSAKLINASNLLNSTTISSANNDKSILILDATDEVIANLFSINLITGYSIGTHLWAPATLLSQNFNVTYGHPANFSVNPIGTGVRAVKPILECIQPANTEGRFIAHFYYDNPNSVAVGLPADSENKLIYEGITPICFVNGTSKPTVFEPGRKYAFSVEFDGSRLIWDLTSFQGTKKTSVASVASSKSARCKVAIPITIACNNTILVTTAVSSLEIPDNEVAVYPNPVTDILTLDLRETGATEARLTVYDALGRVCLVSPKLQHTGNLNEVNMSSLRAGLYLVNVEYGNRVRQIKIIKQ